MRPAFVLEATRGDTVIDLMYVYIPMGLEREYKIQQSVLARFYSHELAACYLGVAHTFLEVGYVDTACTCTIPEKAKKHGTREDIRAKWDTLIEEHGLTRSHLLACEEVTKVSDCSSRWGKIKETIQIIAGPAIVQDMCDVDEILTRFFG